MFVLLPIFAWFLYVFYLKKAKGLYYTETLVFAYHFHTLAFIVLLLLNIINYYFDFSFGLYFFLGMVVYLAWASKTVFSLSWGSTIMKTLAITLLYSLTMVLFFVVAIVNSILH